MPLEGSKKATKGLAPKDVSYSSQLFLRLKAKKGENAVGDVKQWFY